MQDNLLGTTQVVDKAAKAGVKISDRQLRRWAVSGKVPAVTLPSGRFGFRWSEIEPLLTKPARAAS